MSARAAPDPRHEPEPWQLEFVDRAGALLADTTGLPPSHIRVLAWLIVCEPAEQSAGELREALGLSAGAVSMATATLARMGAVERITQPGSRPRHHRIGPGLWERLLRRRREAMTRMRLAAEDALLHAPAPQPRLEEMHDIYAWFEESTGGFISRHWPEGRARRSRAAS